MLPSTHRRVIAPWRRHRAGIEVYRLPGFHAHRRCTAERPNFYRFLEHRHLTTLRLRANDKTRPQRQHLAMPGEHLERPLRRISGGAHQNLTRQQLKKPLTTVVPEVYRGIGVE
ncbi:hypothetical protein D3C80_1562260 [compost metagenome]